jgi:hypothetical protein
MSVVSTSTRYRAGLILATYETDLHILFEMKASREQLIGYFYLPCTVIEFGMLMIACIHL